MSEPAVFVLIRDGQPRYFGDRWASAFLFREILWGPDELERWLTDSQEMDAWTDEACGGAVVDYDNMTLVWSGDLDAMSIPRVAMAYNKLLAESWKGFDVQFATRGMMDLAAAAGEPDAEDYDDEIPDRCGTLIEAAGIHDHEDEDEGYEFDEEETRAWVTLIDAEGAVRHRHLIELSDDLIDGKPSAIESLTGLPAADIPPESVVNEGLWIDEANRQIGFWGGPLSRHQFDRIQQSWQQLPDGWSVVWAENGYSDQCNVSGPSGIPLSDAEALGMIAPTILSTKRFDLETVFGAMGGALKKTAIKATGCLLLVICSPVVLFGAISGNWQAALITVAIVIAVVFVIFKVIEGRVKRSFSMNMPNGPDEEEEERPPVSGPIDETERRARSEQLLKSAGLPALAQIEPHFSADTLDDLLD